MSKTKRIVCIVCLCFIFVGVLAIPVLASEAEVGSGDDTFICAVPCDGTFYVLCQDIDPSYVRGATYDWLINTAVFSFNAPSDCSLLYFESTQTGSFTSQNVKFVSLNNGGSDPPNLAQIYITKAMIVENSAGTPYDRLYLNFAVKSSDGQDAWVSRPTESPAFVNCFDARGKVILPTNALVLKIAQYMPQSSPNIFDYVRDSTYTNGYNRGFTDGQLDGYQTGKNDTYQPAYDSGYNAGYQKALIDSNTFTFRGFLDAVFFAPIDACLKIFDFDFLGFNMRGFVAAVLTLVIIGGVVLVILKFKGGS